MSTDDHDFLYVCTWCAAAFYSEAGVSNHISSECPAFLYDEKVEVPRITRDPLFAGQPDSFDDPVDKLHDPETRITDPVTGGQKGRKLERYELIPAGPLTELARLYGAGAAKYADRNWERGYAWGLSFGALMRHAWLFWGGESIDRETERHHLAAVIFHAMALMEFEAKEKGTDDRP